MSHNKFNLKIKYKIRLFFFFVLLPVVGKGVIDMWVLSDCEELPGKTHSVIQGSPTFCLDEAELLWTKFLCLWNSGLN